MNIIKYNGKIYVSTEVTDELPKIHNDRTWFIIKNMNKQNKQNQTISMETLISLSYIWTHHTYFNLEYEEEIMKTLKEFNI